MAAPDPVVGPGRQLLRAASCAALLLAGVALAPAVRGCCGPALRERLVQRWARLLIGAFGVELRAGPVPRTDGGVLLVANHVSWLDILLVAAVRPARMLAKTEVRAWPLVGPLAAWAGTLFLDRDRLRALPATVDGIAAALRRGERVAVFPEGSTWCGRRGGRFRPALFEAAVRAGATVQPMALHYRLADGRTATVAAFVGEDGLLASLRRVLAARGLVAEVEFRAPVPAGAAGRRELAAAAQAAVFGTPVLPAPAAPVESVRHVADRLPTAA
ncbi:lysophospholipid acyltransferase family protein [Streptomyces sp. NRRL B-24484]|uniref:lysophospholipid acyltransferase family protein n=1 Tax=Streptomyces sp. NRRL B-24484 TaxID=1463833 RepID=UPI000AE05F81|nr:lysophospholipid acyltransferase family protein [Streptomyces sp. NRRL B-24484]